VGTGATYTVIPPQLANEIGLVRLSFRVSITLANDKQAEVKASVAEVSFARLAQPLAGHQLPCW